MSPFSIKYPSSPIALSDVNSFTYSLMPGITAACASFTYNHNDLEIGYVPLLINSNSGLTPFIVAAFTLSLFSSKNE